MSVHQLRKLIREEVRQILKEEDIIPIGPDGKKITDKNVIKNLNMAMTKISPSLRSKVKDLITDPDAAKDVSNIQQKTALMGAMAIAFGISEKEFTQIIEKIKKVLKQSDANATGIGASSAPGTISGTMSK